MVLSYYLQYRLQITHKNPNLNKQLIFIFILQKKKRKEDLSYVSANPLYL